MAGRCELLAADCIADHLAPVLDGRAGGDGQWSASCPAHADDHRSLSVRTGTKGQRIVWRCHRGCTPADVRAAMLDLGVSARCVPWRPPTVRRPSGRDAAALAEIERIITGDATDRQGMRLLIGMALWDCGPDEAARKLGVSRATRYRAVSRMRQTRRSPESHE